MTGKSLVESSRKIFIILDQMTFWDRVRIIDMSLARQSGIPMKSNDRSDRLLASKPPSSDHLIDLKFADPRSNFRPRRTSAWLVSTGRSLEPRSGKVV